MKRMTIETAWVSALLAFCTAVMFSYRWIKASFGIVTMWQIMHNAGEDPSVLSASQLWKLAGFGFLFLLLSAALAVAVYWVFAVRPFREKRWLRALVGIVFVAAYAIPLYLHLDMRLGITREIKARFSSTTFLADHFKLLKAGDVKGNGSHPNLVFIMVESLEDTFSREEYCGRNALPRLSVLRERGLRFVGQEQVFGTECTAMAQTGMYVGVPRVPIDGIYENVARCKSPSYRAPTLFKVLEDAGYVGSYVQGGKIGFGSTGTFFEGLENFRVVDFQYFIDTYGKKIHDDDDGFGVHDGFVIDECRREFLRLSKTGRPFALFGVTLDTHAEHEYLPDAAPHPFGDKTKDAFHYADSLVADFVGWMRSQPAFTNTLVVVMGDHKYMQAMPGVSYNRRSVFNMFLCPNARRGIVRRKFAAFDWAPTVLELMGFQLPEGRMGCGVSLVHQGAQTLLERVGVSAYEAGARQCNPQFLDILYR